MNVSVARFYLTNFLPPLPLTPNYFFMPATLGRGLDALLTRKKGTASEPVGRPDIPVTHVSITAIDLNPHQPRQDFDEESLESLADSIRQYGILQPLIVTRSGDRYQLIAGERRLRAAQRAGLSNVPVVLRDADTNTQIALALIENIQRVDLNPIELAKAYQRLKDDFGLTHEQIAQRMGKSKPVIANTVRFLSLPSVIQEALRDRRISEAIGKTILSAPTAKEQIDFFNIIIEKKLTRRGADHMLKTGKVRSYVRQVRDVQTATKEEELREHFGTKIAIRKHRGKGAITISFYSDDEYRELVKRLGEA